MSEVVAAIDANGELDYGHVDALEVVGSVHGPHYERVLETVPSRDPARQFYVDLGRGADLDADDSVAPGFVEEAGHLEARDAEFLGDIALARAIHEVAACNQDGRNHLEAGGLSLGSN